MAAAAAEVEDDDDNDGSSNQQQEEQVGTEKRGTMLGAMSLIVGTSIGSGILALPQKTSPAVTSITLPNFFGFPTTKSSLCLILKFAGLYSECNSHHPLLAVSRDRSPATCGNKRTFAQEMEER